MKNKRHNDHSNNTVKELRYKLIIISDMVEQLKKLLKDKPRSKLREIKLKKIQLKRETERVIILTNALSVIISLNQKGTYNTRKNKTSKNGGKRKRKRSRRANKY